MNREDELSGDGVSEVALSQVTPVSDSLAPEPVVAGYVAEAPDADNTRVSVSARLTREEISISDVSNGTSRDRAESHF